MSINSVMPGAVTPQPRPSAMPEHQESKSARPDRDGDRDDVAGPSPVVNTQGEPTGLLVNETA